MQKRVWLKYRVIQDRWSDKISEQISFSHTVMVSTYKFTLVLLESFKRCSNLLKFQTLAYYISFSLPQVKFPSRGKSLFLLEYICKGDFHRHYKRPKIKSVERKKKKPFIEFLIAEYVCIKGLSKYDQVGEITLNLISVIFIKDNHNQFQNYVSIIFYPY